MLGALARVEQALTHYSVLKKRSDVSSTIEAIRPPRSARIIRMKTLKLVPVLLLLLGVAASPLRAQDDSNKSLGEKTSESLGKAKDGTVDETHKVANTTRHESHKVANTTRHESHKVANTTRHTTHKVANITRHESHRVANTARHVTHKKSDTSSDAARKTDGAAAAQ